MSLGLPPPFVQPRVFALYVVIVAALGVPSRASADAPRVALQFSAPEGCPSADAVRARILALAAPDARLDADVTVTALDGRFRAVLHVRSASSSGERTLEDASCDLLAESAAVVLAMSATSPAPVAPAPPPPEAAPPPAPPPSSPRSEILRLRATASLDVGTLPTPTLGAGVSASFPFASRLALALGGTAWAQKSGTLGGSSSQGATFTLLTGDAAGCYRARAGAVELSPCAVVEVAHVDARGFGLHPSSSSALWLSLGAAGIVRWTPTPHFALVAELDALVPTQSESFVILHGGGTVHTIAPVAGRASIGPEVRF